MTKINAKYLTKVYKSGDYALKNCSLNIKDGEFLVVVGESGAGKSTLLKVLAGTEELSSGELYFDGILAEGIPAAKRNVSMVFQEYVLYPHMTVFDNLATPLRLAGEDERSIYERVTEVLHLFDLEVAADVKPKSLSGGEQQRVALAKTLLKRSKLVLFDEPMSNVDEKSRWEYCRSLKKMKQQMSDSTFIYVTHNTREALFLADRIAIMQDGAILQVAPRDFLISHFEHFEGMQVLGAVENILDAEFDGEQFTFNGELLEEISHNVDYSKLSRGQKVMAIKNAFDDAFQIFDVNGVSVAFSSAELCICGYLEDNILKFADQTIRLSEEYMSRLLYRPAQVKVVMQVENLSKTLLNGGFPLIFEVVKNGGDYVVLKLGDRSFILSKRTALQEGERIRLYYKSDDLVLYSEDKRLTCHYPLHRNIDVNIYDAELGKVEILNKRIKLKKSISKKIKYARVTEEGFELSYDKSRCAVRVEGCLDEEFINGRKLSHIKIKGVPGYLSFITKEEITCFGKRKLWLNIYPNEVKFEEGKI